MQEKGYLDNRKRISDLILSGSTSDKSITTPKFGLVSANLFRFLPEVKFEQHKTIFKEILLYNQLTHFEQTDTKILDNITVENLSPSLLELCKQRPCVFSSFHFGMYRLMSLFLASHKIPFSIIIPRESLIKEGELFRKMFADFYSPVNGDSIRFIEMESPALALKMIRELKQGRNLFIYFDGYRGAGNVRDNNRYQMDGRIDFLAHSILARQGIAYIAYTAGVPLITGLSYYKQIEDLRLRFFEPIFPDPSIERDLFAYSTTQMLYNQFADFVLKYPGQWEAWLYLHKSLESISSLSREQYCFKDYIKISKRFMLNHNRYAVFGVGDMNILFDKESYTSYSISREVYMLLEGLAYSVKDASEMDIQLSDELFRKGVIMPAAA